MVNSWRNYHEYYLEKERKSGCNIYKVDYVIKFLWLTQSTLSFNSSQWQIYRITDVSLPEIYEYYLDLFKFYNLIVGPHVLIDFGQIKNHFLIPSSIKNNFIYVFITSS